MDLTFRWCVKAHTSVSKIVFSGCSGLSPTIIRTLTRAIRLSLILFSIRTSSPKRIVYGSTNRCAYRTLETLTSDTIQENLVCKQQIIYPRASIQYELTTIFAWPPYVGSGEWSREFNQISFQSHKNSICETKVYRCAYHIRHECRAVWRALLCV